jgi:two-component system NarL family sensor kinase
MRPLFRLRRAQFARAKRAGRDRRIADRDRARLGRELHDGVVQALIAVDMQIETARRTMRDTPAALEQTLAEVQRRLRAEQAALRAVLDQASSPGVSPSQLLPALHEVIWRFKDDTDLAVVFACDLEQSAIRLPRRVCGELVRILREGLVNVRRHAAARQVTVQLLADERHFMLRIVNDGRELTGSPRPRVISARAALVGGSARLIPMPEGARLEVTIPREGPWRKAVWFES